MKPAHILIAVLLLCGLVPLVATATAHAQSNTSGGVDPDAAWLKASEKVLDKASKQDAPKLPEVSDEAKQWARAIMGETNRQLSDASSNAIAQAKKRLLGDEADDTDLSGVFGNADDPTHPDSVAGEDTFTGVRVFTTLGKGDGGQERFKNQLKALAGESDVQVFLRGLGPNMTTINDLMHLMAGLVKGVDGAPSVSLAPMKFRKLNITSAPTVVYYDHGNPVARLEGSLEIDWLKDEVANGKTGNLGSRGPSYDIAERNLMDVIRERWAKINWAKKKQQAIDNFWSHYDFTDLPQATETATHTVDPTIEVAKDLRTPKGYLIARKGQIINPLHIMPFTEAIVAFDATVPKQVTLAKHLADQVRGDGLRPVFISQGLPGDPSFDALGELRDTMGQRVFILGHRIIHRFHLTALPAVIKQDGDVFSVRQYAPRQALAAMKHSEGTPDAD